MQDEVLEIKNLELSFKIDEKFYKALYGVNLSFKKGKIHAIVGESGSGKTVSMMCILRLLDKNAKIDSGDILFEGKNILDEDDKYLRKIRGKKIALIPQDPMTSLNPLYTIQNQMAEVLDNKKDYKRLKQALIDVDIKNPDNVLKSYPHELSGGMKQRVIIATALLMNSEIIIADEPTTALDVTVQKQILDLLYKFKKMSKTVILITHNLGIVSNYADDVYVMYKGHIVEYNLSSILFKDPKHPYTKALIDAIPNGNNKSLKNIKGTPPSIKDDIKGCPYHTRCENVFDICKTHCPQLINGVACNLYLS